MSGPAVPKANTGARHGEAGPATGFGADWLSLREPFDRAARSVSAAAFDWPALQGSLRGSQANDAPVTVLDLACGTGANLRALAPRLGGVQRWLLVDHDSALLAAVPAATAAWAGEQGLQMESGAAHLHLHGKDGGLRIDIERRCIDLATGLDVLPWTETQLVSASALLDLVSAPWLQALVGHCRAAGAAVLWALSVDGRTEWWPHDPADEAVQALFGAHQRQGDKGFLDPALGTEAPAQAAGLLVAAGYRLAQAPSDWQLDALRGGADLALLRAMVEGIAQAAAEQSPAQQASAVAAWRARRLAKLATTRLRVGHQDLIALL